ncbi:DegV family protein [Garciella nitratireducens]|uniref:DegV family protein n=1 Tax=Garciella nitratireducens TaxID=218205 RepID=UPI001BD6A0F7|nr:DegV family protein [Garciella nitratireducens]
MSNIQIIIDSTAYFTREEVKKYNIKVVPLSIHFEGEEFPDPFLGEFGDYYERLAQSKDFPTTSMPSTGAFLKAYQDAINEGKEILVLTFSSKLSGTYQNALISAEMVDQDKITVIDTFTAVGNFKYLVLQAVKMVQQGKTRQEIAEFIEDQKTRMDIYLTVDSLEYLRRGGRLTNASAFIGSILNIKPIIQLKEGELVGIEKTRGKKGQWIS